MIWKESTRKITTRLVHIFSYGIKARNRVLESGSADDVCCQNGMAKDWVLRGLMYDPFFLIRRYHLPLALLCGILRIRLVQSTTHLGL